jgi:hypothetical protein
MDIPLTAAEFYIPIRIWRTLSPASNKGFSFHDFYDRQALVLAGRISFRIPSISVFVFGRSRICVL